MLLKSTVISFRASLRPSQTERRAEGMLMFSTKMRSRHKLLLPI